MQSQHTKLLYAVERKGVVWGFVWCVGLCLVFCVMLVRAVCYPGVVSALPRSGFCLVFEISFLWFGIFFDFWDVWLFELNCVVWFWVAFFGYCFCFGAVWSCVPIL